MEARNRSKVCSRAALSMPLKPAMSGPSTAAAAAAEDGSDTDPMEGERERVAAEVTPLKRGQLLAITDDEDGNVVRYYKITGVQQRGALIIGEVRLHPRPPSQQPRPSTSLDCHPIPSRSQIANDMRKDFNALWDGEAFSEVIRLSSQQATECRDQATHLLAQTGRANPPDRANPGRANPASTQPKTKTTGPKDAAPTSAPTSRLWVQLKGAAGGAAAARELSDASTYHSQNGARPPAPPPRHAPISQTPSAVRAVRLTDALQELDDLNLDNLTNGAKMRTYLEGLGDLFRTAFRVEGHAVAPIAHTDIGYALQQKGQHKVCFEPFSSLQEFNQDFVQQWLRADGAKCRGLAVRVQLNPCPTGDEAASQEAQTLDSIYLPPPPPVPEEPAATRRPPGHTGSHARKRVPTTPAATAPPEMAPRCRALR